MAAEQPPKNDKVLAIWRLRFGGSTDFNISRVADQDETYKNFSTPYRPKYVAPQVRRQESIRQTENYGARVYKRNDGSYFTLSMLGHRTVNDTTLYKYAYSEWGPNGLAVTVRKDLGPNIYQYYKFINDNGRTILNSIIVSSN